MPIRPENRHRYPPNWPDISHSIRTERAAGRCECLGECGRGTHSGRCPNRNGTPAYGTGSKVVLTVAHLDHTPENCDPANLRAFCQGCHLHYDREHHRQTAAATRRAAVEAAGQLTLDHQDHEMPETRLTCISPAAAAAVVAEAIRPGDTVHTVRQDGAQVVIGYHDKRWPLDVADWAGEHGHAHDDDAARVIAHL
ncbi:hypothetical protein ACFRFJ_15745 [Streptomyces hydrogenans]|uniref:hypothetical protein n=1 Tax=Streptomyces hydrogenans TaxID=1873719 RepID=UPI003674EA37